jgi:hypothetical protein
LEQLSLPPAYNPPFPPLSNHPLQRFPTPPPTPHSAFPGGTLLLATALQRTVAAGATGGGVERSFTAAGCSFAGGAYVMRVVDALWESSDQGGAPVLVRAAPAPLTAPPAPASKL